MSALYELTGEMIELNKIMDESDEMAEAVTDTLEAINMEFDEKGVNIVKLITNLDSTMIAPIDEQIKRLQDRKKTIVNKQNSLREYLRTNMIASGITKIDCPLFSITLRKAAKKVEITDESKIPDDYVNVKTVITPDKRKILADLKEGVEIEGATLTESQPSLVIK